jgi:hypothetical protein
LKAQLEDKVKRMRLIEPPIAGQVFAGTGGSRKVVSVKKRSDRMNDYNIEWQRPDNDWRSTVMWLPYWARWVRTAKLVSSNKEIGRNP